MADEEWAYLCNRRHDIRVRVLSNRLYQLERQRIMEQREGIVKVASLVAGSVAFARLANQQVIAACVAVIFVGTSASLVFGWGSKARDAAKRSADWVGLERDIEATGERGFTEADLDRWSARCNEIESGEPAANQTLFERCYLRACQAMGTKPADETIRVPWWRVVMVVP